jgi:thioredoxin reductase (NADPH)
MRIQQAWAAMANRAGSSTTSTTHAFEESASRTSVASICHRSFGTARSVVVRAVAGGVMAGPVVLAVDDDPDMLAAVERELRKRYEADYEVICAGSAAAALRVLEQVRDRDGRIAVVLADLWMPQLTGPELLSRVHRLHPAAKRVVMVDWFDRRAGAPLRRALAFGQIDDLLSKPLISGDEHFHQGVSNFLYEWARQHGPGIEALRVVGPRWSPRSHEIRDVLARNSVLFSFHDVGSAEGRALLDRTRMTDAELPVVVTFDGTVLQNPSNSQIAEALGVLTRPTRTSYDLAIIGAGPAGLAAAVYAASEGLMTVGLEQEAIGGQAASSSLIRNYLGFPRGISGTDLAARAFQQAGAFGAHFVYGKAIELRGDGASRIITLQDGSQITSRAVIIATGVSYRRLEIPALDALIGSGVFYGAAASEAQAMTGEHVFVVGGANSAGQAAVHLARHAAHVTLLVRGGTLTQTMSDYLIRTITAASNITVRYHTDVVDASGGDRLTNLVLRHRISGATDTIPAAGLFILIGAQPHTSWLPDAVQRDRWGFILTGADLLATPPGSWPARAPLPFETSLPGVLAVGDVRHQSTKRVASAVGEGSVAVRQVHEYLAQQ